MTEVSTNKPNGSTDGGYSDALIFTATLFAIVIVVCMIGRWVVGPAAIPGTFHHNAQMACNSQVPEIGFTTSSRLTYKLPDVGRPQAVIVAPVCLKLSPPPGNSDNTPVYYLTEIVVYIVVTPEQLSKLFPDDTLDASESGPVGVGDDALAHLLTGEERGKIEYGSEDHEVDYYLSTPDMSEPFKVVGAAGHPASPVDILTGDYYCRQPSPSAREANTQGPVIRVPSGTK